MRFDKGGGVKDYCSREKLRKSFKRFWKKERKLDQRDDSDYTFSCRKVRNINLFSRERVGNLFKLNKI